MSGRARTATPTRAATSGAASSACPSVATRAAAYAAATTVTRPPSQSDVRRARLRSSPAARHSPSNALTPSGSPCKEERELRADHRSCERREEGVRDASPACEPEYGASEHVDDREGHVRHVAPARGAAAPRALHAGLQLRTTCGRSRATSSMAD